MPYFTVGNNLQLDFVPHYPIRRDILAPQLATPLGNGVSQLRRRYGRPMYQFTLREAQAETAAANRLFGFVSYVQGDIPFFWSGGEWGAVTTPALVGYGDGVRTQFLLPNRYITGNLVVYVDGTLIDPTPSLDGMTGLITTAAALAGEIKATFSCVYKVTFGVEGDVLQSEQNLSAGLFSQDGVKLHEFVP